MSTQSLYILQKFISDNKLKREDGIIHFDAIISLYKKDITLTIHSAIQVITLPEEMALYILIFSEEESGEKEMYRTKKHQFGLLSQTQLEILDTDSATRIVISPATPATENK